MKERRSLFSLSTIPETQNGSRMCTGRFGMLFEGRRKGMVSRRGAEAQGRRSVASPAIVVVVPPLVPSPRRGFARSREDAKDCSGVEVK